MKSFSKDSKYKENVVWVGFLLEGKSISHSLGVIIGKNKILTVGELDFNSNQSVFMVETGRRHLAFSSSLQSSRYYRNFHI